MNVKYWMNGSLLIPHQQEGARHDSTEHSNPKACICGQAWMSCPTVVLRRSHERQKSVPSFSHHERLLWWSTLQLVSNDSIWNQHRSAWRYHNFVHRIYPLENCDPLCTNQVCLLASCWHRMQSHHTSHFYFCSHRTESRGDSERERNWLEVARQILLPIAHSLIEPPHATWPHQKCSQTPHRPWEMVHGQRHWYVHSI